jgi:hypothetical protein
MEKEAKKRKLLPHRKNHTSSLHRRSQLHKRDRRYACFTRDHFFPVSLSVFLASDVEIQEFSLIAQAGLCRGSNETQLSDCAEGEQN